MCCHQGVIEKKESIDFCRKPVLRKTIDFINLLVIDEVWICPYYLCLVDPKSGRNLGIYLEDYLWALGFSKGGDYHLV